MVFKLITALWLLAACLLMAPDEASAARALSTHRVVTCDAHVFHQRLRCERGVIGVQAAVYGRQDRTTCSFGRPPHEICNAACFQPGFVDVIKRRCDGKRECNLHGSDVHYADPCYGTYKYVATTFSCFPSRYSVACEHNRLNLRCGKGHVLFVYSANYGRHDHHTCSLHRPPVQLYNTHCSRPTNFVAQRCNGKRSCSIHASNHVFGDPCFGTYKYLTAAYECRRKIRRKFGCFRWHPV